MRTSLCLPIEMLTPRPADMYIADLTEVLCQKKRLQNPVDWVLCLADLSIALPTDRTVASLEGKTDLALVKRQWADDHGLQLDGRRGGDPNCALIGLHKLGGADVLASIFKRMSEPPGYGKLADYAQTYKVRCLCRCRG